MIELLGLAKYMGLMTFLMMLSVVLLHLSMTLLSIYAWSGVWFIASTRVGFSTWIWPIRLYPGSGSELLIFMLKKFNLLNLTGLIILVLLMWKCGGLLLNKNHLLRCWNCFFILNLIRALRLSILQKLLPSKLDP